MILNKKAFSLMIAMFIVLICSLLAIVFLGLVFPFSKFVSGSENSSKAYYLANSGFEEIMYQIKDKSNSGSYCFRKNLSPITNIGQEKSYIVVDYAMKNNIEPYYPDYPDFNKDLSYECIGVNNNICQKNKDLCKGDYHISTGNPIQIDLSGLENISNFKIEFKNGFSNLDGIDSKSYISWQLSSGDKVIISDKETSIKKIDIGKQKSLSDLKGKNLYSGKKENLESFFKDNCKGKSCILKFSIIDRLLSENGGYIPYLSWSIENNNNFNLRYINIESKGISNGYMKKLKFKIPNFTINEAFDYAVVQ